MISRFLVSLQILFLPADTNRLAHLSDLFYPDFDVPDPSLQREERVLGLGAGKSLLANPEILETGERNLFIGNEIIKLIKFRLL